MNRPTYVVVIVLVAAALILARSQLRQEETPQNNNAQEKKPELPHQPAFYSEPGDPEKDFNLHLTYSRPGVRAQVRPLTDSGTVLAPMAMKDPTNLIRHVHGATSLKITAPGHRSVQLNWPQGGDLRVHLEPEGEDISLYRDTPTTPDTEGPVNCALRILDNRSGKTLAHVSIFLDGQPLPQAGRYGEASIPFEQLRSASTLSLKLDGYKDLTLSLSPGLIDELQAEPLLMSQQ